MPYTLRENYWSDPALKRTFIEFLVSMFRLDLTTWDAMGYWDNDYSPFSLFDGDKMVSSLCLYSMATIVDGHPCLAGQFSAVATHPDYRRRGLSAELMKRAAEQTAGSHAFFFLFANEAAFPFYKHCGYRLVTEYKTRLHIKGTSPRPGAIKLDMADAEHRALAHTYALARTPVSSVLGINCPRLFMFWCLYGLRDAIYEIPDLRLLVLCRRTDRLLTIFDIVGTSIPPFATIYPYISAATDRMVEMEFVPDRLELESPGELVAVTGNGTHLLGNFGVEHRPFIFPWTSHA